MLISELFEATIHNIGPMDPIEDKEEFFKIINQVKQSAVYKRLTKIMDDVSGSVAKRNGTIMLAPPGYKEMTQGIYKIQRNGQIRISNDGKPWPQQARLKSPEPPNPDQYQRYIECLEEVEKKYKQRQRTEVLNKVLNGNHITDLRDIDLTDAITLSIKNAPHLKNLIGCPSTVKTIRLQYCYGFESFEGC